MDNSLAKFECIICFEEKDPHILPCGHSGCSDCLENLKTLKGECHICKTKLLPETIVSKNIELCYVLESLKPKPKPENRETTFWSNLILNANIELV